MDRRLFLQALSGTAAASAMALWLPGCTSLARSRSATGAIDRRALVARHDPVVRSIDPFATLSVGNGSFAFTADATGLQSFPDAYTELPLATQSEWGWHSYPNPEGYRLEHATSLYDAHGRPVPYASGQDTAAGTWLRENPHRLSLARGGLELRRRDGSAATPADLRGIEQRLDLWSGTLLSAFQFDGHRVEVQTRAHPQRDLIAVRIEAPGLAEGQLAVRIAFPYGGNVHSGDPADWTRPERHRTEVVRQNGREIVWQRTLDRDGYTVSAQWAGDVGVQRDGAHAFRLQPSGTGRIELVVAFSPELPGSTALPSVAEVARAGDAHWERFWSSGGAIDLSGSTDERASELERRIVLSQYLTAIQCSGNLPPQETGLTFNSWFGKAHLEMHWWHAAHFPLWNRTPMLERSLPWYRSILPRARETARQQGYRGVRWPKMIGPGGRESPSGVGVFLIWQQPHPIYFAELVYRTRPERSVLDEWREIVFETAEFMASYPHWDAANRRYVLGPPLIPAQESHPPRTTFNPTFELAYWEYGLRTAQRWRERLGLPREQSWDRVIEHLSPLPMRDGLYVNTESAPHTFTDVEERRDHPTVLGAYGFVPPQRVDREAMRRTLHRVMTDWQWDETWGWDYPLTAMTAARVGEPRIAVDALLMRTAKNHYHPNGHNYQRPGLTIYLPGNGGLLAAVAMMAAGWDGAPDAHAPGFPRDGWQVRWEALNPMP
jgi:protein-glucosylgalactosylhydroxylysine glucosidase